MVKASVNGSAIRFVIDETTMSFRYEYYINGNLESSEMEMNGELIDSIQSDTFNIEASDIEDMIHTLFYEVSGRELTKIDMNEEVKRWKLVG